MRGLPSRSGVPPRVSTWSRYRVGNRRYRFYNGTEVRRGRERVALGNRRPDVFPISFDFDEFWEVTGAGGRTRAGADGARGGGATTSLATIVEAFGEFRQLKSTDDTATGVQLGVKVGPSSQAPRRRRYLRGMSFGAGSFAN